MKKFLILEIVFIAISLVISLLSFYFSRFVETCPPGMMCIVGGEYRRGFPISARMVMPTNFETADIFSQYYFSVFAVNAALYFIAFNLGFLGYVTVAKKILTQKTN